MQKQAVLVCSVCALAAILTIAITMTLLKRGKTPAAPGEQPSSEVLVPGEEDISDHYQISETSAALLPETADVPGKAKGFRLVQSEAFCSGYASSYFRLSATATATATVAPTIGLLPMPRKPIISTCAGTEEEPAN